MVVARHTSCVQCATVAVIDFDDGEEGRTRPPLRSRFAPDNTAPASAVMQRLIARIDAEEGPPTSQTAPFHLAGRHNTLGLGADHARAGEATG